MTALHFSWLQHSNHTYDFAHAVEDTKPIVGGMDIGEVKRYISAPSIPMHQNQITSKMSWIPNTKEDGYGGGKAAPFSAVGPYATKTMSSSVSTAAQTWLSFVC